MMVLKHNTVTMLNSVVCLIMMAVLDPMGVMGRMPSRTKDISKLSDMFPECKSQIFNPLSSSTEHQCANMFAGMASLVGLDVSVEQPGLDSLQHMEVFIDYCNNLYMKHKYRILMMGWNKPSIMSKYSEQAQKELPNPQSPLGQMAPSESLMLLKCHDLQSKIEAMRTFVEGAKEDNENNSANVYAKQLDKCQGLFFTLKAGQYEQLIASFDANGKSKADLGRVVAKCHSLIAILNGGSPDLLKQADPICRHCKKCRSVLDQLGDGKLEEVEKDYHDTLHLGPNEIGQAIVQCHKMGIKAMLESLAGVPHGPHMRPPLVQNDAPRVPAAIEDAEEQCISPSQLLTFFQPVIKLMQMQPSEVYNDMPLLKQKAEEILEKRTSHVKAAIPKETAHICEMFLALKSALPEIEYKCCGVHTVCQQYLNYIKRAEIENELKQSVEEEEDLPEIPADKDENDLLPPIPTDDQDQLPFPSLQSE